MMYEYIRMIRTIIVVLLAGSILVACSRSPTVRFYTLSETQVSAVAGASDLAIAIVRADFPRSLARNQIVTRAGDTQLIVDEYNVWAGPLDTAFLSVLGSNIASELGTDRIAVYPSSPPFDIDYQIMLDVLQFDGVLGDSVTLRARWTIRQAGKAVAVGAFNDTQAIAADDKSYDALVAAHSAAIGELSQQLSAELIQLAVSVAP